MVKLRVTYTCEIDAGNLPDAAVAEYLLAAEKATSDWNVWEVAGGTMTLESIKPAD